jgi:hypothetical protein
MHQRRLLVPAHFLRDYTLVFVICVELHSARRNHRKMIWAQPFTRRTPAFDTILGEEGLESFAEVEDGRAEERTQVLGEFRKV